MDEMKHTITKAVIYPISLVLVFTLGIAIYMARNLLPTLGYVLLISCIVILGAGTLAALLYAGVTIWKKLHEGENIEIGQYGNAYYKNGKFTKLAPLTGTKVKEEKSLVPATIVDVPTLQALLTSGYLPRLIQSGKMLFGYIVDEEGEVSPHIGDWDYIRTCALGGKSRHGKSVTMFLLVLQAVLARAQVYVCDTNFPKPTSLYKLLLPLEKYITFGKQLEDIAKVVDTFHQQFLLRQRDVIPQSEWSTQILFVDEWNSFVTDRKLMKQLASVIHIISNQGAGFNMFCIIGGQSWQPSYAGGNALINSFHAAIVHHLEDGESRRLLERKYALQTGKLKLGHNFMKDTSGDTIKQITPLGTRTDAYLVLQILEQGFNGVQVHDTPVYQRSFNNYNPKQLRMPDSNSAPHTPVLKSQEATQGTSTSEAIVTTDVLPSDVTASQEAVALGKSGVTTMQEHIVLTKALEMKAQGVVGKDGGVVRTKLRDELGFNNKQYTSIIMPVLDHFKL